MNPIPSLPTDNLYKFCAVAGGVAMIVSGLVIFQAWRDVLGQERSIGNLAADQANQGWTLKLEEMTSKPWWQPDGTSDAEAAAAARKFQEQAKRIEPVIEATSQKLKADRERLELAKYDFRIVGIGTGMAAVFGFVLAIYGFYNWRMLQLKQDQLLELELRRSRASVSDSVSR